MSKRYGIAEWYGNRFDILNPQDIRSIANNPPKECPFRFPNGNCNKSGGVCSMRIYTDENGAIIPADSEIVTMCPNRFIENGFVFQEVSKKILNIEHPCVTTEIPFLLAGNVEEKVKPVGMIDMVIADTDKTPLNWCAMEIQAVYFSGKSMSKEINSYKTWDKEDIPFPTENRRPDFRSSGPKRLMPQLQIKVPTISRWGKKMVVVIDKCFWESMSEMTPVKYLSNCDIIWYILDYKESGSNLQLFVKDTVFTTLSDAVSGLTGGIPTSAEAFEQNIKNKIKKSSFIV